MAEQPSDLYEPSQPPVKPVVTIGLAFAVTFVAMAFVSIGIMVLFTKLDTDPLPSLEPLAETWQAQSAPQLVTEQGMFLAPLRAAEDVKLGGYAWVNQAAGVARIPIDTAMDLVVGTLPVRGAVPEGQPPAPAVPTAPGDDGAQPADAVPGAPTGEPTTATPTTNDPTPAGAGGPSVTDSAAAPAAGETNPAGDSEAPNR